MFYDCERCGELAEYPFTTNLVGGATAILCVRCRTAWNRYCPTLSEYTELVRLETVLASIRYARELSMDDTEEGLERVIAAILECKMKLLERGLAWIGRASEVKANVQR